MRSLGEHGQRGRATTLIRAHGLADVGALAQLSGRRRAPLELRDHAHAVAAKRITQAARAHVGGGGPVLAAFELGERRIEPPARDLRARARDDPLEDVGGPGAHRAASTGASSRLVSMYAASARAAPPSASAWRASSTP